MYVYRFLNKNDDIIYIGKTINLNNRQKSHIHLPKECYDECIKIQYIKLDNQDEMSIYERYLINIYNPKYNTQYNNQSTFCFELPNKEWKDYNNEFSDINMGELIIYKFIPNLTDGELGKLYKLLTKSVDGILIKGDSFRSNPMNKYDISKFLNIEIKATERFIKRLTGLGIMYKSLHKGCNCYRISNEIIKI